MLSFSRSFKDNKVLKKLNANARITISYCLRQQISSLSQKDSLKMKLLELKLANNSLMKITESQFYD